MASDDINVIIYKILRYLYECKKAGKQPRQEDVMYNASLLQIPESYWKDVLLDLSEKGLIKGVNSIITKDGKLVYLSDGFGIVERWYENGASFNCGKPIFFRYLLSLIDALFG